MLSYLEKIDASSIEWIKDTLSAEPDISRTQLAEQLYQRIDWKQLWGQE